ncbi:LOW QUALITY PROTEIN: intraflagellar transport protein 122 homolog [Rhipicephalus sanguineus]|uniref:LOW QUALITY PROTEIN: intraflagellar transport protein 122 homolog n=1 Tax=Rhipicephalus sanguineus TaxID=34632 RepID=UPI0020C270ED|nr:LOW QUALITY PROTEIN: intraflagellar transport protein 122 homolog [Rhipicephalus sanguineus]
MRAVALWVDKVHDRENNEQCIYDLVFKPDGSQLIVAAGTRVLVYDTSDGALVQPLKGHKDAVYCVSYARDGKRFASGGADKQVIIWTASLEGILKYSHHDSIQCLTYNPLTHTLVSCSCSDFGLWSSEQKSVSKHRTSGRVTSAGWNPDGQFLALGLATGTVSIRGRSGEEVVRIDRPGGPKAAVWGVCWNPVKEEGVGDVLAVADWAQTLSFYNVAGQQTGRERALGFDPTFISYFPGGEYLVVGGSCREARVYTRDGICVGPVSQQASWVWCCQARPDASHLALGCQDGTIAYFELGFSTVHSLYRERYAYRDNMTDVIIQHLVTDEKVRIKCRDLVKKLAIYKHRLAVQLPERIMVYELSSESSEPNDMHYRLRDKIVRKVECTLLVVCSEHLVLCQERRLQCLRLRGGACEREWVLSSAIRYIRALGGPVGREGLLVGLRDGQVLQLLLDNPFPLFLIKVTSPVRCLDLSADRTRLAVVDEKGTCLVYQLDSRQLLFQEPNANSVAWNTENAELLCFTGGGALAVKAGEFPVLRQKLEGFVVGFGGCKLFCLQHNSVSTVEVPLSPCLYQYIEKNRFREALTIACLGVPEEDWRYLAKEALEALDLVVAKRAAVRLGDPALLRLVRSLQDQEARGEKRESLLGDVMAQQGRFSEAARLYKKAGRNSKAVDMYTDLRMFEVAQILSRLTANTSLELRSGRRLHPLRSVMSQDEQPSSAATPMLAPAATPSWMVTSPQKDPPMFAGLRGEDVEDWLEEYDRIFANPSVRSDIAKKRLAGRVQHTGESYTSYIEDVLALCRRVDTFMAENDRAFAAVGQNAELRAKICGDYANWLAEHDRFVDAQKAFYEAGRQDEALKVLERLTQYAVDECRFRDAGYFYWLLSRQILECASKEGDAASKEALISRSTKLQDLADVYYIYHNIHRYIEEPFTAYLPEALFNMSRYLFHQLMDQSIRGVSLVGVLYALSKQSRNLGAHRLARHCYEQLQNLHVPLRFRDTLDLAALTVRSKPFSDAQDLLPLCYRCSSTNPLINQRGRCCVNCSQPFVHSFIAFEVLPLVEFTLAEGISDSEAFEILEGKARVTKEPKKDKPGSPSRQIINGFETLQINHGDAADEDPFAFQLSNLEEPGEGVGGVSVILDREALATLGPRDVVVCRQPEPLRCRFYRNVVPDVVVVSCPSCAKVFTGDDFEMHTLQTNACPFCRTKLEDAGA